MKKILFASLLLAGLCACSSSDDTPEPIIDPVTGPAGSGCFVINQGTQGLSIEGTLGFIDDATSTYTDSLYLHANGVSLGDTPQYGIVYGSKAYIAMSGSNLIHVIDPLTCRSMATIRFTAEQGEQPRSLVGEGGKLYVSLYDGHVARVDTATFAVDASVKVGPNPEIMAAFGGKLYVPNSDGLSMTGFGTTASVIDLASFSVEKTITVPQNPSEFMTDGHDLYMLAKGNYYDVPAAVYRIDPTETKAPEKIIDATYAAIYNGALYSIDAPWNAPAGVYSVTDLSTGTTTPMLSVDGVEATTGIAVNPANGNILVLSCYIGAYGYADYSIPGYINEYVNDGTRLLHRYEVGINPAGVFFKK